jgi:hypothetical protein
MSRQLQKLSASSNIIGTTGYTNTTSLRKNSLSFNSTGISNLLDKSFGHDDDINGDGDGNGTRKRGRSTSSCERFLQLIGEEAEVEAIEKGDDYHHNTHQKEEQEQQQLQHHHLDYMIGQDEITTIHPIKCQEKSDDNRQLNEEGNGKINYNGCDSDNNTIINLDPQIVSFQNEEEISTSRCRSNSSVTMRTKTPEGDHSLGLDIHNCTSTNNSNNLVMDTTTCATTTCATTADTHSVTTGTDTPHSVIDPMNWKALITSNLDPTTAATLVSDGSTATSTKSALSSYNSSSSASVNSALGQSSTKSSPPLTSRSPSLPPQIKKKDEDTVTSTRKRLIKDVSFSNHVGTKDTNDDDHYYDSSKSSPSTKRKYTDRCNNNNNNNNNKSTNHQVTFFQDEQKGKQQSMQPLQLLKSQPNRHSIICKHPNNGNNSYFAPIKIKEHREIVSAIFELGLKHSSPLSIYEKMCDQRCDGDYLRTKNFKYSVRKNNQVALIEGLNLEKIKSKLQKYRKKKAKSKSEFLQMYDQTMNYFISGVKRDVQHTESHHCSSNTSTLSESSSSIASSSPSSSPFKSPYRKNQNVTTTAACTTTSTTTTTATTETTTTTSLIPPKISSLNASDIAAYLSFSVLTEDQEEESLQRNLGVRISTKKCPSLDSLPPSTILNSVNYDNCHQLILPALTESEKNSPIGQSFQHVIDLINITKQSLQFSRADNTSHISRSDHPQPQKQQHAQHDCNHNSDCPYSGSSLAQTTSTMKMHQPLQSESSSNTNNTCTNKLNQNALFHDWDSASYFLEQQYHYPPPPPHAYNHHCNQHLDTYYNYYFDDDNFHSNPDNYYLQNATTKQTSRRQQQSNRQNQYDYESYHFNNNDRKGNNPYYF